ncbi:hypothetical protein Tco_0761626 [Tanacetum coccineum]
MRPNLGVLQNPPSKNKTNNLEQLVGVPKPTAVDVNNPTVGSTKGRKKLRIKGGKEKAIEKSLKGRNSCSPDQDACFIIQHGCEAALKVLPADMEAQTKAELNKKAHSAVILCLGNKVLREVTRETTAARVWSKLKTLYMTKSLANKLYLKKKLYTFYMPVGQTIFEHIDEFNKIVLDFANIEVNIYEN